MQLVIISGRSGSGKSTALNVLEDVGYYCIDNLPAGLLPALIQQAIDSQSAEYQNLAVSIDARNRAEDFSLLPEILTKLPSAVKTDIIYLDANSASLIKRFSETRRKHPLSNHEVALKEAIAREKELLEPIASIADLKISTNEMSVHELRNVVKKRVIAEKDHPGMSLLLMSFGYKRGIPIDADIVFDLRCLPNPYWIPQLRGKTGQEPEVQAFLGEQPEVVMMRDDILQYLDRWLPCFEDQDRSYMTIAIGCTGGYHRSVYMVECLTEHFRQRFENVQLHHRELARASKTTT